MKGRNGTVARSKFRACAHDWHVDIALVLQYGYEMYACRSCGAAVGIEDQSNGAICLAVFVPSGTLLTGIESRSVARSLMRFLGADADCISLHGSMVAAA
jgi:hypothetical protein